MTKKVLYIEDNDLNYLLVEKYLTKVMNIEVLRARNLEEALSLYKKEKPDLVFVDISLCGESGLNFPAEVEKVIKEERGVNRVPLIALTARATDEDKREILKAGFNYYITKPIELSQLKEVVVQFLK